MRRWFFAVAIVAGCGARTDLGARIALDASTDAFADDAPSDAPDASSACPAPVTLAQTAAQPDAIAIDGEWIYWHDGAGVFRVKKTGGPAHFVAKASPAIWPDLVAFALAGGFVFYADGDVILRAPVGGGTTVPFAFTLASAGFATDASHVFAWSRVGSPTEIDRFDFSGAGFTKVDVLSEPPSEMVFDGKTAYAAADPGVWKLGFGAGDELLSGLTATDVAVDGATVYFTSDDATNGARVLALSTQTLENPRRSPTPSGRSLSRCPRPTSSSPTAPGFACGASPARRARWRTWRRSARTSPRSTW